MNSRSEIGKSIFLCFVGLFVLLMAVPIETEAYTRSPSGDPAEEPITFTVTQSDIYGGSCANGKYVALQIRFDGQAEGYGSITDWTQSNGSSDITWSDLILADGFQLEYTGHPTEGPVDVLNQYVLCNDNAANDYGWTSAAVGATFEWQTEAVESTSTATTTQIMSDDELGAWGIVVFILGALVSFILIV